MTCKICGKKLPEGSTVCPSCGASIQPKRPAGRGRYSKKGKARKIILSVILLLIALAVIGGVIFGIVWAVRHIDRTLPGSQQGEQQTGLPEEPEEPEQPEEPKEEPDPSDERVIPEEPEKEPEKAPENEPEKEPEPEPPKVMLPEGAKLTIDRTETTASIDRYRDLNVSVDAVLPEGLEIASITWKSSDPSFVRADPQGDGKNCRAWGVKPGEATVTATVTFTNGETLQASCLVHCAERKESSDVPAVKPGTDYILADSATRVYTVEELRNLTKDELILARNEIFARHGRMFQSEWLQSYFNSKSWYSGTIPAEEFDASVLNSTETKNISVLSQAESQR